MKNVFTVIILAAVFLAGCSVFDNSRIDDGMVEDVQELQAMLPALEAALAVTPTEEAAARTISTTTATSNSSAPDENPGALYTTLGGSGTLRWPANESAYMEDLYGNNSGNRAYFEIQPDGSLYRISLYIYPLLSTSVNYIKEEYLVAAGNWEIVDSSGSPNPLAYLSNTVYYFDGRVEQKTVKWVSTAAENLYYGVISVPDNTSDTAYDYPASVSDAEPGKSAGAGVYSAKSESVIPGINEDSQTTAVEYYSEVSADEFYSASYIIDEYTGLSGFTSSEKQVQRYSVKGSTKTVRSKLVAEVAFGSYSSTSTTLETVDIGAASDGRTTYESVVTKSSSTSDIVTTVTTTLTETGDGTNVLVGEMVYDDGVKKKPKTYDITIDSGTGLSMDQGSQDVLDFASNDRAFGRLVKAILDNGSEFSGYKIGDILKGLLSNRRTTADVSVGSNSFEILSGSNTVVQ